MQISMLGCDPEVLLVNEAGKYISSVGLIGGSKDFPRPIDDEGNAVQEDNVSVEFNTPPCKSSADFIKNINKNKEWIRAQAERLGLAMVIKPSAVFDNDQLNTFEAQTFGCDPDYNAWNGGRQNPRPSSKNKNLRSCGGHIHIALNDGDDLFAVIKAMDLYVGCIMLEFDDDTDRRELYGKAGAFRKKSYGVEYRTASNRWIESDERIQWVWDQTEKALAFARSGREFNEEEGQLIRDCINNSDVKLLGKLKEMFDL